MCWHRKKGQQYQSESREILIFFAGGILGARMRARSNRSIWPKSSGFDGMSAFRNEGWRRGRVVAATGSRSPEGRASPRLPGGLV